MNLEQRVASAIRSDIQGAAGYAIQPSAGFTKLDAMENPFALPPELQRELGERLSRVAINRYPQGKAALAERIASHFDVPDGCMLGNGSDELIDILSLAFMKPGATILAPLPGFVMYEMSATFRGLRFTGVPLTAAFELDEIIQSRKVQGLAASPSSIGRRVTLGCPSVQNGTSWSSSQS